MLEPPAKYSQGSLKATQTIASVKSGGKCVPKIEENGEQSQDGYEKKKNSAKPKVWIKLKPTEQFDKNLFQVEEDGKCLKLTVDTVDRLNKQKKMATKPAYMTYRPDGILQDATQEEVFDKIASELVSKAMKGTSGMIVAVGPEQSGKFHTLFGSPSHLYQERGIVPRVIEKIFETVGKKEEQQPPDENNEGDPEAEAESEMPGEDYTILEEESEKPEEKQNPNTEDPTKYKISFSLIEIHRNQIRDLITLSPYGINSIGEDGPKDMFRQEITCLDQGLGLLLRGLIGQKHTPRESYSKLHTIAYIDIYYDDESSGETSKKFHSRLTFAKIASLPNRKQLTPQSSDEAIMSSTDKSSNAKSVNIPAVDEEPYVSYATPHTCCNRGPTAEMVTIRRDLFNLEESFIQAHQLRKLKNYYGKLEKLGMSMLMAKPRTNPNQFFCQSKLASCLKDILSDTADIRVILNVRPEKEFLQNTLESMRFAERAKCMSNPNPQPEKKRTRLPTVKHFEPSKTVAPKEKTKSGAPADTINKTPQEMLTDLCVQLSPLKIKVIQQQAEAYFEETLGSFETMDKSQLRTIFENFIEMWNTFWENEKRPCVVDTQNQTIEITGENEGLSSFSQANAPSPSPPPTDHEDSKKSTKQKHQYLSAKDASFSTEPEADSEQPATPTRKQKKHGRKHRSTNTSEAPDKKITPPRINIEQQEQPKRKSGRSKSVFQITPKTSLTNVTTTGETVVGENDNGSKIPRVSNARRSSSNSAVPRRDTAETEDGHNSFKPFGKSSKGGDELEDSDRTPSGGFTEDQQANNNEEFSYGPIESEVPSRGEAMQMFIHSAEGELMFHQWTEQQGILKATAEKNTKVLRSVSEVLSSLNRLQAELDVYQQERHVNGERYDDTGHVLVADEERRLIQEIKELQVHRDFYVGELKRLRVFLVDTKHAADTIRQNMELKFQQYCMETFAIAYGEDETPLDIEVAMHVAQNKEVSSDAHKKSLDDNLTPEERHYMQLKRIASYQAHTLLKSYAKRPPWNFY